MVHEEQQEVKKSVCFEDIWELMRIIGISWFILCHYSVFYRSSIKSSQTWGILKYTTFTKFLQFLFSVCCLCLSPQCPMLLTRPTMLPDSSLNKVHNCSPAHPYQVISILLPLKCFFFIVLSGELELTQLCLEWLCKIALPRWGSHNLVWSALSEHCLTVALSKGQAGNAGNKSLYCSCSLPQHCLFTARLFFFFFLIILTVVKYGIQWSYLERVWKRSTEFWGQF